MDRLEVERGAQSPLIEAASSVSQGSALTKATGSPRSAAGFSGGASFARKEAGAKAKTNRPAPKTNIVAMKCAKRTRRERVPWGDFGRAWWKGKGGDVNASGDQPRGQASGPLVAEVSGAQA